MKSPLSWKVVASLVLIFVAGAVIGGLATHHFMIRALERGLRFENWTAHATESLRRKLNLDPEQARKVRVIFEQAGPEFKRVFSTAMQDSGGVLVRLQGQIDAELTSEQRAIHAEMKRELRELLKRKFDFDLPER